MNDIERRIDCEIWKGMTVAGYRERKEHGYHYASHWSTIPEQKNPERLFTESDVRQLLKSIDGKKNAEALLKDQLFQQELTRKIAQRRINLSHGIKHWIDLRRCSDAPAYRTLPENLVEGALLTGVLIT